MSRKNHLRISAKHLDLDLRGETEYVERAYNAIRSVLLDHYRDSLLEPNATRDTSELPTITPEQARKSFQSDPEARVVNLVLCNEVYNKVYLVESDEFDKGVLGPTFKFEEIRRIYVNQSQQTAFNTSFKFGKVLWRELTAAGRNAVRQGS